jgi:hypothetical protein
MDIELAELDGPEAGIVSIAINHGKRMRPIRRRAHALRSVVSKRVAITNILRGDTGGNARQANSGKVCHLPCPLIDVKFSGRYSRWL